MLRQPVTCGNTHHQTGQNSARQANIPPGKAKIPPHKEKFPPGKVKIPPGKVKFPPDKAKKSAR